MFREWLHAQWFRLKALVRRHRLERDMDDELAFHLATSQQKLVNQGMTPEEARHAARRAFGNPTQTKEISRDLWTFRFLETLGQDLRYGLRQLRRNPGFTIVAVLTLALGIGANTAIFSIIDNLFVCPLPYPAAGRLVAVTETKLDKADSDEGVSMPTFQDWKKQSRDFDQLAMFLWGWGWTATGENGAEILHGRSVSYEYLKILGGKATEGRLFLPDDYEEHTGRGKLRTILSYGAWQRIFGSDPGIIGKTLTLDGQTHTVVGVMSRDFRPLYGSKIDLWTPARTGDLSRKKRYFYAIGRLKEGVGIQAAQAEMDVISARLAKEYPDMAGFGARVEPLRNSLYGELQGRLLLLFGAVAFVLLIACVNVANLMLARATARDREFAIRCSVGGGRTRLIRQLLTESTLLAVLGAALGLSLAYIGVTLMVRLDPDAIPKANEIALNLRVLGFTFLITLVTGVLFGLLPALVASKPNLNESLKETGRGARPGFAGGGTQGVLVVSEVALSLILLIGAGLMIHNIWRLLHLDLGFNPKNLITMVIKLPQRPYVQGDKEESLSPKAAMIRKQIRERLQALPGVKSVSLAHNGPLQGCGGSRTVSVGNQPPPREKSGHAAGVCFQPVTPDYFRTIQTPIVMGRDFTEQDKHGSPPVAVINEALAQRLFPSEIPIGKLVRLRYMASEGPPREIVGVVRDFRQNLLRKPFPELYVPYSQLAPSFIWDLINERIIISFVVRTAIRPASLAPAMRRIESEVARDVPVGWMGTTGDMQERFLHPSQLYTWLLIVFAGIAVVLTVVGVFGVTSYSVNRRTHEIGIRMALGAEKRDVLNMVVGQGLKLALVGVGIGIGAAFGLTRFLSSLLYGVKPTDPLTFIAVSLILIAVALLACYIPARRATKIDPMVALRYE